jgi:single-stranded-DNA-specific exonuclease
MKSLYNWQFRDPDAAIAKNLSNKLEMPEPAARALANRGVSSVDDAIAFMNPSADDMHSPALFHDIAPAVERILRALDNHERILIFGDYDVDGITSTALLVSFLESLGGHVRYYIPERDIEGYGISSDVVRKTGTAGYGLVITVDTGVTAFKEIQLARELGVDVIVTDHHEPPEQLPEAVAVINPKRADSKYPFRELAGVGVAFKLAAAVGEARGIPIETMMERYGEFVALGTVADMVPLVDENRFFANYGLARMPKSRHLGIYSLLEVAGIGERTEMETDHISFGLAPRINAAGRVWRPRAGVELLLAKSPERARLLARKLDDQNKRRMVQENRVFESATAAIKSSPDNGGDSFIVMFDPSWQIGIMGVVASKLMETRRRPVALATLSKNPEDMKSPHPELGRVCQATMRSVPGFDIFQSLNSCSDLLIKFGGHALAAGMKIYEKNIPAFKAEMNRMAAESAEGRSAASDLRIDSELSLNSANLELIRQCRRLKPFGVGNPEPVFASIGVAVLMCRAVGADNSHLQIRVGKGNAVQDCIGFRFCNNWSPDQLMGENIDIAYVLKEDAFGGRPRPKLHLKDIRK